MPSAMDWRNERASHRETNVLTTPVNSKSRSTPSSFYWRVRRAWVIDPRHTKWISYWDLATTSALFFTALVTPVEVAFIEAPNAADRSTNALWLTNRFVDLIFIFDMYLQLRVAVKVTDVKQGTYWVTNPPEVAFRYLTSFWFPIDLFSISTSIFDIVEFPGAKSFTALRAVRVLRLAKLVRLARGSRIFKTWEMQLSINYSYLSLATTITMLTVGCHWFACIWGLQASFNPLGSWMGGSGYCVERLDLSAECQKALPDASSVRCQTLWLSADEPEVHVACVGAWPMYCYALYFAIMTITSVGYGDILAQPFNTSEQAICSLIMLCSGMIWGYLIGTFCNLASNLSPSVKAFRAELSQLNTFMTNHRLPRETRFRLREYLHESIHLRLTEERNFIFQRLSPAMQGEISVLVNQRWLREIWYLRDVAHPALLIELASQLKSLVFPPLEFCPSGFLYIVQRGSAFYAGKVLRDGQVWGEDVLLDNPPLQLDLPAIASTYLGVFIMNGKMFISALAKFPEITNGLRSVRNKWAARRAIVRAAERACYQSGVQFRGRMHPIYAKELARYEAMEATMDREDTKVGTPKKGGMRMLRTTLASRTPNKKGKGGELELEVASGYREAAATLEGLDLNTLSPGVKKGDPSTTPGKMGYAKKVSKNEIAVQQAATEYGLELRREQMTKMISESGDGSKKLPEFANAMEGRMTRVEEKLDRMCDLLMSLDPVAKAAKAAEEALSV